MTRSPFVLVPELAAFFGKPARRYVVRRSFAYWQAERRAFGIILWGRPEEADVDEICAAHEVGANPLFRGHTSLVDLRAVDAVDFLAFERLLAYLKKRRDDWSPNVSQQAVLHRGGFAHASVVGMFQFLRPGHPVKFFDDPVAAYDAVGAADVRAELEELRAALLDIPAIVRRVQTAFEVLPPRAGFPAVARSVGMSVRTLQRHLAMAGSSLRHERQNHMLRASERLLEGTELDLDAIAAQVGASSASHLVTLFRSRRGTTPGAIRERRRGPTPVARPALVLAKTSTAKDARAKPKRKG
ncbi:MAG: helix-turn-helix transcriptional regulator [Labilithrix sp.]|nr:helix-turn-helix transcriptional regulator [Labilithrix sp.]